MDTLDFFRRVLPSEGTYCRFALSGKRNAFFDTLEELAEDVQAIDQRGQDAYYAISSFKDSSSRRNINVHATKVFTIDVDCGEDKPFPTWKEGLSALGEFISAAQLPKPLIIRSGYGLHCYWILDQSLGRDAWSSLARALKDATVAHSFKIDPTKTADPSLVLRPIGTHNFKNKAKPREVKVVIEGGDTTLAAMHAALDPYYKGVTPTKRRSSITDNLAAHSDMPPAVPSMIVSNCAQVRWGAENQTQVEEPFWYALMGIAAYCEEPEDTARAWSENHPGYSESNTLKKMEQWKEQADGPTTCAKFESERSIGCKGCPFYGKISSPIRLGVRYKEVDTSAEAPEEAVVEVPVPKHFRRTDAGIVLHLDGVDTVVAPFDIYPLSYGYDEHLGYEVAQYMWDRRHVGWTVLTLRQAYLAEGTYREFVSAIADQGIVLDNKKQTEYFQVMLRAYTNELRKLRTVTNLYSTMGWKDDNNIFVLGDDLYRRDSGGVVSRETIRLAAHVNRAGSDLFTTGGSFEVWKAGTGVLGKANMFPHQFSIGVGFASVLMQFTGLKGVTVSFYGPSGSGKSQAQLMQQSVWGDPEKLHFQSKFTANSLFHRFGLYGSLPMTVDEATQMSDKDVGDYLYWVSQGRDKARLTRSAEEKAPREWALMSTLSTNKPISSKLVNTGDETDAQLARLLELRVEPSAVYSTGSDAGRKFHRLFTQNYGHAGRMFLERLMGMGEAGIRAVIANAFDEFPKTYNTKFTGVERYWEVAIVLVDLALKLAYEWGITAYSQEQATRWSLKQIEGMRDMVTENQRDGFDLMAQYVNEHLRNTLLVYHDPGSDPLANMSLLPQGAIRVRVDGHRRAGSEKLIGGTIMLERTLFRRWMAENGGNLRDLEAQIIADGYDATPASKKASLGKHSPISPPQCYVVGVDLRHPRLVAILEGIEANRENAEMNEVISIASRRP